MKVTVASLAQWRRFHRDINIPNQVAKVNVLIEKLAGRPTLLPLLPSRQSLRQRFLYSRNSSAGIW
jgi:hypothetical protein